MKNSDSLAEVAISDLLATLTLWGDIAHDEKSGFIEKFCPHAWILTSVTWDSENMRFVYILESGQHVCDSVKMPAWVEFIKANVDVLAPAGEKTPTTKTDV